jgi:hypothetical protein
MKKLPLFSWFFYSPAAKRLAPVLFLSILALSNLACAIGMLTAADPVFTTSGGNAGTQLPPLVFPTEVPSPTPETNAALPVQISNAPTQAVSTIDPNVTPVLYYAQSGDSLESVARRFAVDPSLISSPTSLPTQGMIPPNQLLIIPHGLANTTSALRLLPDSEFVYSPTALDFDVDAFVLQAGGYLSSYREWLGATEWTSGASIIQRVALENSINPRLLLAVLEYQSGWVYAQPDSLLKVDYPLGYVEANRKGLYGQLIWAVNQLSTGYYGWRDGILVDIQFPDGVTARLAPDLNAGTVALQYYYARVYGIDGWVQALNPQDGFITLYTKMYGDAWLRAEQVEPLFPAGLTQPSMILPFFIGQLWSYTGGPHGAWEHEGSLAALDFSPARDITGCVESPAWVLSLAPGLVVRAGNGIVVVDSDGDGNEQTGWAVLYLHIATSGRVAVGTWLESGDLVGHPSCEGGISTGTHVHIARRYNGEWVAAGGPIPFVMDGWIASAGSAPYKGTLQRDGQTVTASVYGSGESHIIRSRNP